MVTEYIAYRWAAERQPCAKGSLPVLNVTCYKNVLVFYMMFHGTHDEHVNIHKIVGKYFK